MKTFLQLSVVCLLALGIVGCSDTSPKQSNAVPTAATQTVTLAISGMHCDACALSITKTLKQSAGVSTVDCTFEDKQAVIAYDPATVDPASFLTTIEKLGYTASIAVPDTAVEPAAANAESTTIPSSSTTTE